MFRWLSLVVLLSFAGCGVKATPVADFVPLKGKVTFNGAPVKNANLVLQPTVTGHMCTLKLTEEGTFSGEIVPGAYAYYFSPIDEQDASDMEAFRAIPDKYRGGDVKRTVTVAPGQELNITLE